MGPHCPLFQSLLLTLTSAWGGRHGCCQWLHFLTSPMHLYSSWTKYDKMVHRPNIILYIHMVIKPNKSILPHSTSRQYLLSSQPLRIEQKSVIFSLCIRLYVQFIQEKPSHFSVWSGCFVQTLLFARKCNSINYTIIGCIYIYWSLLNLLRAATV